jgi:hypothetical protein
MIDERPEWRETGRHVTGAFRQGQTRRAHVPVNAGLRYPL